MTRIRYQVAASLDGYIAGPNHGETCMTGQAPACSYQTNDRHIILFRHRIEIPHPLANRRGLFRHMQLGHIAGHIEQCLRRIGFLATRR